MQIVKTLFSQVTVVWSLYAYVRKINTSLKSWPGTNEEIRLRAWLLDNIALLAGLASKTVNPVDDAVVYYTVRIIENDTSWKILYSMLSLTNNLRMGIDDGATVPQNESENLQENVITTGSQAEMLATSSTCIRSLGEIENTLKNDDGIFENSTEKVVENPLLIISAVGLILQVIQYIRNR